VSVVVAFDVFEDFDAGVGRIFEASVLKHFELNSADAGLGPSIVIRVSTG